MDKPIRILYVDDYPFDRELVRNALEEYGGFDLTEAGSRKEFESHLAENDYDLVLTDFNILGFDGLQVLDAVQAKKPGLPVIIVTGTGSEEVAVEAMKRGVSDYVIKNPRHIQHLPLTIQTILEKIQMQEEGRQAKEAQKRVENLLRETQAITRVGGWELDVKSGTVTWTDEVYSIYGVSRDYDPSHMARDMSFYEPRSLRILQAAFDRALNEGEAYDLELEFIRGNGERIWVRTIGRPQFKDGQVVRISGNFMDITERKRQAMGIEAEQNKLLSLLSSIPDEVWFADSNQVFTLVNPPALREFTIDIDKGIKVEQLARSLEVLRPDGSPRPLEEAPPLRALKGEEIRNQEEIVRTPASGELRYRQVSSSPVRDTEGDIIGAVSIVRDITEQKQAEKALQESEKRYRSLFENMMEGYAYCRMIFKNDRPEDFIYLNVNRAFDELTGLKNVAGKKVSEVIPGLKEFNPELFKIYGRVSLTGRPEKFEIYLKPLKMWLSISVYSSEREYFVAVFENVTERKRLEQKLLESQKMQTMAQLATGVAHEVRNPLNAILAVSEALFQDIGENPEYQTYLGHIRTQVNRLSNLMKDLLELGRPVQLELFRAESLGQIVRETKALWQASSFAKGHELVVDISGPADRLIIKTDPVRLEQVLVNLLDNAAQNSPEGSSIRLTLQQPDNDYCKIRIVDQGFGIYPENLPRVFDPFFTTRRGGTGLGLSLVKGFVESMGGTVSIRNNDPPPGCTVEITLPIAKN